MENKFQIDFSMDNAAFEEEPFEVVRILRDIADKIEKGRNAGNVRDVNGNTIGHYGIY